MRKIASNCAEAFIALVIVIYIFWMKPWNALTSYTLTTSGFLWFFVAVACIIATLLLKALKMYLILIEKQKKTKNFFTTYFKATLAMYCFPYKTGEFCRMYYYAELTGNASIGIFSVMVDRYFDTAALLTILVPLEVLLEGRLSILSILLLIFIGLVFIAYKFAYATIMYLNKHIVLKVNSRKAKPALAFLDVCENSYQYIKTLLNERTALVYIISICAWIFEYLAVKFFSVALNIPFGFKDLASYLSNFFAFGTTREISQMVAGISIFIVIALMILNLFKRLVKRGGKR